LILEWAAHLLRSFLDLPVTAHSPGMLHASRLNTPAPLAPAHRASPRKIAIMGRALDQRDGLGLYCRHLLYHMVALDPASHYVILLTSPRHSALFKHFSNAEVHVLPSRSKLWWDQVTVARAARRLDVDLIFNPKFSVPLFTRRPCAFVLQDSDWYINPGHYPWWDNLYIRLMLPLYCRKAKRLMVISQSTLGELAHHGVVQPAKAEVTYAAVGANFTPRRDEQALSAFRSKYRLPEAFILTAARAYHTGHAHSPPYPGGNNERLVHAYQLYRAGGGALPLVVAGHQIEPYLRGKGFRDADLEGVRFVGFIPNEEMHLAYQLAQFFVVAKLCESFGLPILEALACGCPAIVPNTCASPEVAGGAARLIDPYDEQDIAEALLEVGGSEPLRREMRERGLDRAGAFTWPQTAQRTLAVLRQM
jgi:glycosyltransferase involved in cell wall biosynthesis